MCRYMKITIQKLAEVVNAGAVLRQNKMHEVTPLAMNAFFVRDVGDQERFKQREVCNAIRTLADFAEQIKTAEVKVS